MGSVIDFLADQFQKGREYRSLNCYKSALSSTLGRVDGFPLGNTLLCVEPSKRRFSYGLLYLSMLSGLWIRYLHPWSSWWRRQFTNITEAVVEVGHAVGIMFSVLSVNSITFTVSGVKFTPRGLAKQSRVSKLSHSIKFSCSDNAQLCPVRCVRKYISATSGFLSRLWTGTRSTVPRYFKTSQGCSVIH